MLDRAAKEAGSANQHGLSVHANTVRSVLYTGYIGYCWPMIQFHMSQGFEALCWAA